MADNENGAVVYEPQEFPLYYQSAEQLKLDGVPSGKRGAVAELLFTVNNYPQIFYGLRLRNSWSLPDEFWRDVTFANTLQALRMLDGEQTVRIDLAQQNVIARPIHQDTLVGGQALGSATLNWHPFPCPYFFRGGNEVRVRIVRLIDYPTFLNAAEEEVEILPTVHGTLVAGVLVSDMFPAAGPPSSGAESWRRRG